MATQKGILTPWQLQSSGRRFIVDDTNDPPCFQDRWGVWVCGHDHEPLLDLQDAYQYAEGWTAQT
jgi:hypothetical protein